MKVKVLTETDLRKCVRIDRDAVAEIEKAFTWLSEGKVIMPPIMHIEVKENKGDVDPKAVVEASDIVVTSTPSRKPYIKAEWLHPGLHITCMGADLPEKQELEPEVLGKVDVLACDHKSQCIAMGELHHGLRAGILSNNSDITELGEITSGRKHGLRSEDQITLCDLTGTGVQDTAIALLALQKTGEQGLGIEIDNRRGYYNGIYDERFQ